MTLKEYPELIHLEIRGNRLKAIPQELVCQKLTKLYLGANQIINTKIQGFNFLQVLHLRGNKISSLAGIEKLPELTYLNLR
jgi:Leucine-rich repeat (LRR) protein